MSGVPRNVVGTRGQRRSEKKSKQSDNSQDVLESLRREC